MVAPKEARGNAVCRTRGDRESAHDPDGDGATVRLEIIMLVFLSIILFFNSSNVIATILTFFCFYSEIMLKKLSNLKHFQ